MKKLLGLSILFLLVVLAGCNSKANLEVKVNKPLYYQAEKTSNFEIKVSEKDQPVKGLKVNAAFAMTDMDHGSYEVDLEESEDGIYSGEVKLSMAGDWEIVLLIENDGETIEKILEYEVKEAEGTALINGEWITDNDMEFYHFINDLHIAISRVQDEQTYKGKALEEAMAYWDSQEKMNEDRNQLLTQIIRLRSIALLGTEKGHKATKDEIEAEITKVKAQYNQFEIAKEMIKEYGEQRFWGKQEKQYELIVLSQKVQLDLIETVKKENPDVNQQEINFIAQKKYEELLVSQVNSLDIDIF